jgi:hypothetical protein
MVNPGVFQILAKCGDEYHRSVAYVSYPNEYSYDCIIKVR